MSLLRRGNRRHGIGDFAEKRSQGVLLRASFLHVFAHSRLLSAYFAEQLQRDVFRFISHGVIHALSKIIPQAETPIGANPMHRFGSCDRPRYLIAAGWLDARFGEPYPCLFERAP